MPRKVLIIVGHPDPNPQRFCRALAQYYAEGARSCGHLVRVIDIAALDFPLLRSAAEFEASSPPPTLVDAARAIQDADHLVFIFPLWLGTMPALLKGFLEQVMRPGLAFAYPEKDKPGFAKTLLDGRSARVVVTMGMPALFYRFWYLGHGIAGFRRNVLSFVGIKPVRESLFGMVNGVSVQKRESWLVAMRKMGETAS